MNIVAAEKSHYHENIIKELRSKLKGRFNVIDVLDDILIGDTDRQQIILDCENRGQYRASSNLLDILLRCPSHTFIDFTKALCKHGRKDLAQIIYEKVPKQYKSKFSFVLPPVQDPPSMNRLSGASNLEGSQTAKSIPVPRNLFGAESASPVPEAPNPESATPKTETQQSGFNFGKRPSQMSQPATESSTVSSSKPSSQISTGFNFTRSTSGQPAATEFGAVPARTGNGFSSLFGNHGNTVAFGQTPATIETANSSGEQVHVLSSTSASEVENASSVSRTTSGKPLSVLSESSEQINTSEPSSKADSVPAPTGPGESAPTTSTGLFGSTSASTTSTTAATTALGGLFVSSDTTGSGLFGSTATSAANSTGSVFGSGTPGAASGVGLFGSNTTTTTTTTTGVGFFGPSTTSSGGLFGSNATTTASGGLLGSSSGTATPSTTSTGLFGSTPTATTASTTGGTSLFGSNTSATNEGGMFGSGNATTTGGGSVFGGSLTGQSSGFGFGASQTPGGGGGFLGGLGGKPSAENASKNVFASNFGTAPAPNAGFGRSPAFGGSPVFGGSPSFGSAPGFGSSPLFGGTNPVFGGASTFGGPPGGGGPFGSSQTTNAGCAGDSHETVCSVLSRLACDIVREDPNLVNVVRSQVLPGALRAFERATFDPLKQLSVKFANEFAIDEGGATRELLRLLMAEISDMPIFCGPKDARMLEPNYTALQSRRYFTIGKMMSYSIVHEGIFPAFLSPLLVQAVIEGIDNLKPSVENVADYSWKEMIEKLNQTEDQSVFEACVKDLGELVQVAGCSGLAIQISTKDELCSALIHFVVLGRINRCIDQFRDGLETLGLLEKLKRNKSLSEQLCHNGYIIDATLIDALFTIPTLSDSGSNQRRKEEVTITNWRDFLSDIEAGVDDVSLVDILIFATGADSVPPLGLTPEPQLAFHTAASDNSGLDKANFAYANTCANILDIPIIEDYDLFKRNMISSIKIKLFTNE